MMELNSIYNSDMAKKFATLAFRKANLSHLLYRDLPDLIKKYVTTGNKALDFGCGPGLSTRFLASLGLDVMGVDINKNMLTNAITSADGIFFALIKHGHIPAKDNTFDLVQTMMVLLELPNLETMQEAVNEIARVLKPNGIFVAVVGSEHFHKNSWYDKQTINLEENQTLTSGQAFKTYSKALDLTFEDYFYSDKDYQTVFINAGLEVVKIHHPLGKDTDGVNWGLENTLPPFTQYICRKILGNY